MSWQNGYNDVGDCPGSLAEAEPER
jgi:hypothetical protein